MKFKRFLVRRGIGHIALASFLTASSVSVMACTLRPVPEFDIKIGMTMAEFFAQKGAQVLFSESSESGKRRSWLGTQGSLKANVILPKGNYVINFSKPPTGAFDIMASEYPQMDGNAYINYIRSSISNEKLSFFEAKKIALSACYEIKDKLNLAESPEFYNLDENDTKPTQTIDTHSICSLEEKSGFRVGVF